MQKLTLTLSLILIAFAGFSQKMMMPERVHVGTPQPQQKSHPMHTQALGDTLFYFDGNYYFVLNPADSAVFAFGNEDVDNLTVDNNLCPNFCPTSAFLFFYEVDTITGDSSFYTGATSWFSPVGRADNWLEMGPITIPTGASGVLDWDVYLNDASYKDGYEVLVSTTGMTFADFTSPAIFTIADNAAAANADTNVLAWGHHTANISAAYAGQQVYIAFHHNANDMFIVNFDNIRVTEGPPAGVSVPNADGLSLNQNSPNPFNNSTDISYSLKQNANITMTVTDVTGQVVNVMNEGNQMSGSHNIRFDGSSLTSGIYFYTLNVNGHNSMTRKLTVTK